jgi:hypothetical protein
MPLGQERLYRSAELALSHAIGHLPRLRRPLVLSDESEVRPRVPLLVELVAHGERHQPQRGPLVLGNVGEFDHVLDFVERLALLHPSYDVVPAHG